jgi:predicted hotdog family 3-hydroxylacyl-ACP dehydratase
VGAVSRAWIPAEVLPHRPPLLLLSRIVAWDADSLDGEVDVDDANPFAEPGRGVPRWVALEFMAQAVGALDGIRLREADRSVPPGYLLGTRRLGQLDGYFPLGAKLSIHVKEILSDANGLGIFACSLDDGERSLACQLTVYRPPASGDESRV